MGGRQLHPSLQGNHRADAVVFPTELFLRGARLREFDLPVEFRRFEAEELVPLPFRLEVLLVLWRTMLRRSSGSSEARAFASSMTCFAGRASASLFTSAYSAAPEAGSSSQRFGSPAR